ncbi:MBL fold metallo-hydrolase [Thermococcus celer]|uniref:Hydrolase n=1 Tax=Thermococcus celer Vu 13 = JCM 8558 TaxID=1293037 RepID=A0A218P4Q2_THECE|nr:hydrolase [Thermococcus celer] [Thermococcus celer Vu 13 = JCM 8558]
MRIGSLRGSTARGVPVEIPPHTVMLRGAGLDSNVYLVRSGREALVIDTGTGLHWHAYAEVWKREGYLDGVDKAIIFNTHEHFDHVGGNWALKGWFEGRGIEVLFAAHEETARTLERGDDYVILSHFYGRRFEPQRVDIHLKDGDNLEVGSLELELVHTPGHTAGSACLYLNGEVKLAFTGDTLFKGTAGRTDLPTGNAGELRKSLERLLGYDVDFGLPGHGWVIEDWRGNLEGVLRWLR